jgi:hypothetical protein
MLPLGRRVLPLMLLPRCWNLTSLRGRAMAKRGSLGGRVATSCAGYARTLAGAGGDHGRVG